MKMKRIFLKLLVILTLFITTIPGVFCQEEKTVRVGWFESSFNRIDENGRRKGYAYEYQRRIAAYTNWNYEYVEGTWPELYEKLIKGEIDLLSDVVYMPERSKNVLFSTNAMGFEDYYIFIPSQNTSIDIQDISSINGKTIGVFTGGCVEWMLSDWVKKHKLSVNIVPLPDDFDIAQEMITNGTVDALAHCDNYNEYVECIPAFKLGSTNIYFAVNKNKPELCYELDEAMNNILNANKFYNHKLQSKYTTTNLDNSFLNENELNWILEHKIIRIGIRNNYLPFCNVNKQTGELEGALKEFFTITDSRLKNADIDIVITAYKNTEEALQGLKRGEVDAIFPMQLSTYDADSQNILLTDVLYESEIIYLLKKENASHFTVDTNLRAAVNSGNIIYESILNDCYPEWEKFYFENTNQCLSAINKEKADVMIFNNYRSNVYSNSLNTYHIAAIPSGITMNFCFAVSRNNFVLYSILNKINGLILDSEKVASLTYYSTPSRNSSVNDFIRQYIFVILGIILFFVLLIVILLLRTSKSKKKATLLNEELKEALNQAEKANLAKTAFLNRMSHDIRTPLNGIIGLIEIGEKHPDNKELIDENRKKAKVAANYLLSLISDMLELSRIDDEHVHLAHEPINLIELSSDVLTIINLRSNEAGITLIHPEDARIVIEEPYVFGSPLHIRQIFLNIFSNAIKYNKKHGSIYWKPELVSKKDNIVTYKLIIRDTGIGMSQEFQEHLFEPFSQEHTDARSTYQGTGLGMSIVKGLIDKMGGQISVESELGKGTTFEVTIPFEIARAEDMPNKTEDEKLDITGKRILLVEDNELNSEIARTILQDYGAEVTTVYNGKEAVEEMAHCKIDAYDVILMDIMMPVMDGYEATREIRKLSNLYKASIPIIAMTANAFEEDRKNAIEAGMNGHITKPINVNKLISILANVT